MLKKAWRKLGLLYAPPKSGRHPKLVSHAANPLPVHIADDVFRIFYSGRDSKNRSSVGAVDIDLVQRKVLEDHCSPFFCNGIEGSFYADGVSIGNCYEASGKRYILFMGWQSPNNEHWHGDIGRLTLADDLTLHLESEAPFMGRDKCDPISLSYPWVSQGESGYKMWYGSTIHWDAGNGEMLHVLNFASSLDGNLWTRDGLAVPYELGKAQAFSRPTVTGNDGEGYEMWFSYRSGIGEKYRIGYATSRNGKRWELALEDAGIGVSNSGWDSEMIEYPFVFRHNNEKYMLYNGNGYGQSGFGLAVLENY